jgi:solute carrier family 35 (UDP-xylose/UDP-N-acetylglucosamine transporter), member B4
MSTVGAVSSVFCGCQLNVWALEVLITENAGGIGYGLTFVQFIVVALFSFPLVFSFRHMKFRPRLLDSTLSILVCVLFFMSSTLNNAVFQYNLPVPVHTTFRSSSLVINMALGAIVFRRRYSIHQVVCALAITFGVIVLLLESGKRSIAEAAILVESASPSNDVDVVTGAAAAAAHQSAADVQWFGVGILSLAMVFSTLMGLLQDKMMHLAHVARTEEEAVRTARGGGIAPSAVWAESIFYNHALSVPLYFVDSNRLQDELQVLSSSAYVVAMVALNCAAQYVCVVGVYRLVDRTSSFTVNLVLTLRKFMSILVSVFYFGHASKFGWTEWAAIVVVAIAGLAYPLVPKPSDQAAVATVQTMDESHKKKL